MREFPSLIGDWRLYHDKEYPQPSGTQVVVSLLLRYIEIHIGTQLASLWNQELRMIDTDKQRQSQCIRSARQDLR